MCAKKKVIFCTYSSIYSSKILEHLIADSDIDLVAIINSTRVLNPDLSPIKGAIKQIKNSGIRYSAYLFLITDFFKWMQPLFKLRKWYLRDIHSLARQKSIPILDTLDINTEEATGFIKQYRADYLLCAHFNQLLKEPVLSIDNLQCINIHPSLLPEYKGVDPVFYAMHDDKKEIGVSIHRMDKNFDTGEVLLQGSMNLDKSKSLLFNNCLLFVEGISLATYWIKNDNVTFNKSQNEQEEQHYLKGYDSWPTSRDVNSFKKSGKRLMRLSGLWNQQ